MSIKALPDKTFVGDIRGLLTKVQPTKQPSPEAHPDFWIQEVTANVDGEEINASISCTPAGVFKPSDSGRSVILKGCVVNYYTDRYKKEHMRLRCKSSEILQATTQAPPRAVAEDGTNGRDACICRQNASTAAHSLVAAKILALADLLKHAKMVAEWTLTGKEPEAGGDYNRSEEESLPDDIPF